MKWSEVGSCQNQNFKQAIYREIHTQCKFLMLKHYLFTYLFIYDPETKGLVKA